MLRSLLVGTIEDREDEPCLDLALEWALRFKARLAIVGVVDEQAVVTGEAVPPGAGAFKKERDEQLMAAAHRHVREKIELYRLRCLGEGVKLLVPQPAGLSREMAMREAQRHDVVLVSRRASEETRIRLARCSPRPLVVVPRNRTPGDGVVVAYDGSVQSARALQALVATGLHTLGEVRVLSVHERSENAAADQARRAVDYLEAHGVTVTSRAVVSEEQVSSVILAEVERSRSGLLMMGAHRRTALVEFLLGSVTASVLEQTTVPVFFHH
jgi:nucleotide-binding universal stress UspA family protein